MLAGNNIRQVCGERGIRQSTFLCLLDSTISAETICFSPISVSPVPSVSLQISNELARIWHAHSAVEWCE